GFVELGVADHGRENQARDRLDIGDGAAAKGRELGRGQKLERMHILSCVVGTASIHHRLGPFLNLLLGSPPGPPAKSKLKRAYLYAAGGLGRLGALKGNNEHPMA